MYLEKLQQWRYATADFSGAHITDDVLDKLLNTTRLTASSYGLQPYCTLVIRNKGLREQLVNHSFGQQKVADSSALVIFAAKTGAVADIVDPYISELSQQRQLTNEEAENTRNYFTQKLQAMSAATRKEWAVRQAYIGLGTFLLAAAELEVDSCPMEGIEHDAYDNILSLKDLGLSTVFACPVGYRSEADTTQFQKKVRQPLSRFKVVL
ncbi:nitroreductase family protein [Idiomarina loihiensis]|jgi:nitroreductase|uniref:Nitroreductase n=2 Tax=Idiomarina loihiensis TaxID=135577 RepID=Q5R179_IDILO|nr:nitroreductase family protein [Idiomarina loihiensis]AAV82909.1 Nitroreductase [Idiomarina loihiensis L2TR]AGM36954.1 nitroreductase [Idiomarina loihiensis GSL 199]